ncbi:hypothetical protein CEXT_380381 [Caerostris extrusa]|uniref:Uncharacterized protein n=1 Tax=Caerostris extrusa TaxID=172846 RepID=A0AAV4W9S0_CAEEX|nr:hypothetical protein CEXT_380381 [Caerostris extrusa]
MMIDDVRMLEIMKKVDELTLFTRYRACQFPTRFVKCTNLGACGLSNVEHIFVNYIQRYTMDTIMKRVCFLGALFEVLLAVDEHLQSRWYQVNEVYTNRAFVTDKMGGTYSFFTTGVKTTNDKKEVEVYKRNKI